VSVIKNKLMFFRKEDLGLDGTIILKSIFKTWDGQAWTGLIWIRIETGGGRL
jgi:hypothetical protein